MSGLIVINAEVLCKIADALGIEKEHLRRIVIDLPYNDVPVIYTEQLGDRRLLEIGWAEFKDKMQVKKVADIE